MSIPHNIVVGPVRVGYRQLDTDSMFAELKKAYPTDACYDLYVREDVAIYAGHVGHVNFGFALDLPSGYEALIRSRSGWTRKGLIVIPGTCDAGYRGEIGGAVLNMTGCEVRINRGTKMAQLAIRPIPSIVFIPVDNISQSDRDDNGFGSSGS